MTEVAMVLAVYGRICLIATLRETVIQLLSRWSFQIRSRMAFHAYWFLYKFVQNPHLEWEVCCAGTSCFSFSVLFWLHWLKSSCVSRLAAI